MKLPLTDGQVAEIEAHLPPGRVLIIALSREVFDGTNADNSGRRCLEFASIPQKALPAVREAVKKASAPREKKKPLNAPIGAFTPTNGE